MRFGSFGKQAFHGGSITAAPVLSALQNVSGHRTRADGTQFYLREGRDVQEKGIHKERGLHGGMAESWR